jgi:NAD(P)H-dependent flavin oxidoreductase YrpB (nitropropane dioxygenase family)
VTRPRKRASSISCAARPGRRSIPAEIEANYLSSDATDLSQRVVWAGESVDLVRDIPSAREVIERIVEQAAAVMREGAAMVRD